MSTGPEAGPAGPRVIREMNRGLVLSALRTGERMSRAELAARTSLTKPTVAAIVEGLLADGLVREVGVGTSAAGGGRRPRLLAYDATATAVAGVHLSAEGTAVAVADGLGRIQERLATSARLGEPDRTFADARRMLRRAARHSATPSDRLRAVGVAVAGLVDGDAGRCLVSPGLGWRAVSVADRPGRIWDLPAVVTSSAQAAAYAEGRLGVGVGRRCFLWVWVGEHVGSGVVVDGRLFRGGPGTGAGVGHVSVVEDGPGCGCGGRGCVEAVASARAVVAAAQPAGGNPLRDAPTLADVVAAAAAGDRTATAAIATAGRHVGRGIAGVVAAVNPELVVLGGPLAAAGALLLDPVRAAVARWTPPMLGTDVVLSGLGAGIELAGAALLATDLATEGATHPADLAGAAGCPEQAASDWA